LKAFQTIGALALLMATFCLQASDFVVKDIKIVGAKKISDGTVLNYLPISAGETFQQQRSGQIIRELYKTGFFEYIELLQEGPNLIVKVRERPSIAEITFEGNSEIDDDTLVKALDQMSIARGKIFNDVLLAQLELELQQLYYSLGKYGARITAEWTQIDADRVVIDIVISEGEQAEIRSINITGNDVYDDKTLLAQFKLESSHEGVFAADYYSASSLTGDLETLKSYYFDRGYIKFEIESQQVTISPERNDINITINVNEGDLYTLSDIELIGDLIVDKAELTALIPFREGDVFSRKKIMTVVNLISLRLGDEGYAFVNVQVVPEIDDETKKVKLRYIVEPGQRMLVRFIEFDGNDRTRNHVLRREMRLMEGEAFNQSKLDRSRVRLQRLNYIGSVKINRIRVENSDSQLDLKVSVTERFSGNVQVGLGYSDLQGAIFNLGLTHDNIFGTGNSLSVRFDNSASSEQYSFSYENPYYTADGISRGFNLSFSKTDASLNNLSDYLIDRLSVSMNYGIPLSEYNRFKIGFGVEQNDVTVNSSASDEVIDFIIESSDKYATGTDPNNVDGIKYDSFFTTLSISNDTRNRRIFADSGYLNSFGLEIHTGDLDFYKARFIHQTAFGFTDTLTFNFRTRISYGEAYGDSSDLPFFEKYTAGGVRTVRGYDRNSLGPKDSNNEPFGGNLQVLTHTEILFPVESLGSTETFRLGVYFDAGNVFADAESYESNELRQSVGLSAKWFSLVGPLEFSYAFPINDKSGDDTRNFQFAIGASF
jgi:outer membrane protein insertion porin family